MVSPSAASAAITSDTEAGGIIVHGTGLDFEARLDTGAWPEGLLAEGRTLFLVSHNVRDLRKFCTRGLYLKGGKLALDGPLEDALAAYGEEPGRRKRRRIDPDSSE